MRGWPWPTLVVLGSLVLLLVLALVGYRASDRPATLVVDGAMLTMPTHQRLVEGVLREAGLPLGPADEVYPSLDTPWQPDQAIVVRRALTVTVQVDGRSMQLYGRPRSLLEVLAHAEVTLHPGDDVYVNSVRVPESAYGDEAALRTFLSGPAGLLRLAAPPSQATALRVAVVRATPLYVHDEVLDLEVRTTAATVGAALEEAGFRIYQADQVDPPLDTPVRAGLRVGISRALPLHITADGRTYTTRTQVGTVAEVLQEEGLVPGPLDRVEPPQETPLQAGMAIDVVRVTTLDLTEQITIPFRHLQEADSAMELDQVRLRPGLEGIRERVTRIVYDNGHEAGRQSLGERIAREAVDQVFYYGTRIIVRTMQTEHGPIEYWRKFRVLATSYFPSTCDKLPSDPGYGITYTGKWATRGIIAVDPRVIPLHTRMYVPGYGFGAAEDIGGAIKGRHIDVCFDDADYGKGLWDTHYVDVYLLTPVPPRIPWMLP